MKILNSLIAGLIIMMMFSSCKKDQSTENENPGNLPYSSGVYITNEGIFQTGSGSISFFNRSTGSVTQNVFEKVNHRPLGNIVQSITFFNSKGYIVVNNAAKVEVVMAGTMRSVGVIDDLTSPRYFQGIDNNKAYVSDWANCIAVVDLNSLKTIRTVPTGEGPDKMLKLNDKVFVLNFGGWDVDSTITVIRCNADTVITTIQVYPKPDGIVKDKDGFLWVICSGNGWNGFPGADDSEGHLIKIDPDNYSIIKDLPFPDKQKHPEKLTINSSGNVLYYNHPDGIFRFPVDASALGTTPFAVHSASFYTIGFDPVNSLLYASDPVDYNQQGWIYRFNSINGARVDSFQAGIIPGNFCFQ